MGVILRSNKVDPFPIGITRALIYCFSLALTSFSRVLISLSKSVHSSTIRKALSNLGVLVIGLLHWCERQRGKYQVDRFCFGFRFLRTPSLAPQPFLWE